MLPPVRIIYRFLLHHAAIRIRRISFTSPSLLTLFHPYLISVSFLIYNIISYYIALDIILTFYQLNAKYLESEETVRTLIQINHNFQNEVEEGIQSYSPRYSKSVSFFLNFDFFSFSLHISCDSYFI